MSLFNVIGALARKHLVHAFTLSALLLGGTLIAFDSAEAGLLRMRIEDPVSATGVTLTKTGANPFAGAVVYVGPVGNCALAGHISNHPDLVTLAHLSVLPARHCPFAELSLTALALDADCPGFMVFWLEQTDLTGGDGGMLLSEVSGSLTTAAGSFVTAQTWINTFNAVPNLGPMFWPMDDRAEWAPYQSAALQACFRSSSSARG